MVIKNNWTPLGCGADFLDRPANKTNNLSEFPCDLVERIKTIGLSIEDLFLAWEIARLAGKKLNGRQHRALLTLILAVRLSSSEGSSRLPLEKGSQLKHTLEDLSVNVDEQAAVMELVATAHNACRGDSDSALASIMGNPGDYKPLIIDRNCLYFQKLHVLESRVGKSLLERIEAPVLPVKDYAVEKAIKNVFNSPPEGPYGMIELDQEQKEAIRNALYGKISVISGRPGSGKTSIVAGILRALARIGYPALESVALAAPTGKAADRMRQSITEHLAGIPSLSEADQKLFAECPPSYTLHRLLGYSPGRDLFLHNENNPLAELLVIVDESSMIDLAMMDRLLRALHPKARLILLGDADQLPSIEAGAVLRDICRSKKAKELNRITLLSKSYRAREEDSAGKSILALAASVREGTLTLPDNSNQYFNIRRQVSDLSFQGTEFLLPGNANQKLQFFERWHLLFSEGLPDLEERIAHNYISGPAGFDKETTEMLSIIHSHYDKFRILSVTRVMVGGTGSEEINAYFHNRWSENRKRDRHYYHSLHYMVGEPVMVTRNDYNLQLYNGDSGLILNVSPVSGSRRLPAEPMAVFPRSGNYTAYPLETLRGKLTLAWASTVHKAQGSEYDHIALLLPDVYVRPLTRELLYTAVTRAKKSVSIIGSEGVLKTGLQHSVERASGLTDILSGGNDNAQY